MQVNLSPQNLAAGLKRVSRVATRRPGMPVLENVLLSAEDGRLKLVTTNLELTATSYVEAQVVKSGAITVPYQTLEDIARSWNGLLATIECSSSSLVSVECGRSRSKLKSIPAQDFPQGDMAAGKTCVAVSSAGLRQIITQTSFAAAANDPNRPVLTGIYLEAEQGKLTATATDGVRLSVSSCAAEIARPFRAVIPARAADTLSRLLAGQQRDVELHSSPSKQRVSFVAGDMMLITQTLGGAYPDHSAIIPSSWSTQLVIKKGVLRDAVAQAEIFARQSQRVATLKVQPGISPSAGRMTLFARSAETGDVTVVDEALIHGEPIEVNLDVRLLRDALGAIPTEEVAVEITSVSRPVAIRPVGQEGVEHVVMPIEPNEKEAMTA